MEAAEGEAAAAKESKSAARFLKTEFRSRAAPGPEDYENVIWAVGSPFLLSRFLGRFRESVWRGLWRRSHGLAVKGRYFAAPPHSCFDLQPIKAIASRRKMQVDTDAGNR